MAHKTITISEEAYLVLKRMKQPNESFTKVILRLTQTGKSSKDLLTFLKKTGSNDELASAIDEVYQERYKIELREV